MEEIKVDVIDTSFSKLLKLILSSSVDQIKYTILLDSELISILNLLIDSNPSYFDSIQEPFNSIIEDKKIDVNDIPAIINLLSNLYRILYNHKIKDIVKGISVEKCIIILKFIVEIILKENIKDEDKEKELIQKINNLIDVCGELILIRKSLKTPTSFSFLK